MQSVLEQQDRAQRSRRSGPDRIRLVKFLILGVAVFAFILLGYRYFADSGGGMPEAPAAIEVRIGTERVALAEPAAGRLKITVMDEASAPSGAGVDRIEMSHEGLKRLLDALGGILVNIPETIEYTGEEGLPVRIDAGMRRLDADRVENYFLRPHASPAASMRAILLGVALRSAELLTARANLVKLIDASLEAAAKGEDGKNAGRLAALMAYAANLGPTDISIEWKSAAEPAPAAGASPVAAAVPSVTLPIRVRILNGTGKPGLAARAASHLPLPRYEVVETANADRFGYRATLVRAENADLAAEVVGMLGTGRVEATAPREGAHVEVILGADARNRW